MTATNKSKNRFNDNTMAIYHGPETHDCMLILKEKLAVLNSIF